MKKMYTVAGSILVTAALAIALPVSTLFAYNHASNDHDHGHAAASDSKNIVETAVAAGNFETLAAALQAGGLVDALSVGDKKFTVFAPTDSAFEKLPEGTVEYLLENPDKLRRVLLYHVVEGQVKAEDVVELSTAKTLLGGNVTISTYRNRVRINGATVTTADIEASNGVIHVINEVLIPKNIAEVATEAGQFKTLLAAVEAAGLVEAVTNEQEGQLTVFAPTDEAFAKLPEGTVEALLEDTDKLREILLYHVVSGRVTAGDVVKLNEAKTVQGQNVSIDADDDGVRINSSNVVLADVMASNGVIHVIDTVLLPPEAK